MIDPKYARYLKPSQFSAQLANIAALSYHYGVEKRWSNFPRYETILKPGDAIWIPSWWFHEVQTIQGEDWQISVAIRFGHILSSLYNNLHFSVMADLGTPNKPCWRGFRLVCFELHPGWDVLGAPNVNSKMVGGLGGSKMMREVIQSHQNDDGRYE